MITILHTILFTIYSAVFPWLFGEHANPRGPAYDVPRRTKPPTTFRRLYAKAWLNFYFPFARPVLWWRHTKAINQLLDDIGWIDLDFPDF
jgi:hypothetical protein